MRSAYITLPKVALESLTVETNSHGGKNRPSTLVLSFFDEDGAPQRVESSITTRWANDEEKRTSTLLEDNLEKIKDAIEA